MRTVVAGTFESILGFIRSNPSGAATRAGWNGKGLSIVFRSVVIDTNDVEDPEEVWKGDMLFLCKEGSVVGPWYPSVLDILAADWLTLV